MLEYILSQWLIQEKWLGFEVFDLIYRSLLCDCSSFEFIGWSMTDNQQLPYTVNGRKHFIHVPSTLDVTALRLHALVPHYHSITLFNPFTISLKLYTIHFVPLKDASKKCSFYLFHVSAFNGTQNGVIKGLPNNCHWYVLDIYTLYIIKHCTMNILKLENSTLKFGIKYINLISVFSNTGNKVNI